MATLVPRHKKKKKNPRDMLIDTAVKRTAAVCESQTGESGRYRKLLCTQ